ncbi:hypothetical protein N7532_011219 [Penicillium argentinense]|uniref:Uncharacterized protein n=1 Tax=Penicillium argentinense TaxID=1131581 RepID=A0A9W9EI08_9EURO|nr:uncharacterized protein N7532_011219 [Penicillium argentinense]KAJ5082176.1 hypothetical protein N7532_011219 [Penicillium argentinense]
MAGTRSEYGELLYSSGTVSTGGMGAYHHDTPRWLFQATGTQRSKLSSTEAVLMLRAPTGTGLVYHANAGNPRGRG